MSGHIERYDEFLVYRCHACGHVEPFDMGTQSVVHACSVGQGTGMLAVGVVPSGVPIMAHNAGDFVVLGDGDGKPCPTRSKP